MQGQGTPPVPRSLEEQVFTLQQQLQGAHMQMQRMGAALDQQQQRVQQLQEQSMQTPLGAATPTGSLEAIMQQFQQMTQQMLQGQQQLITQVVMNKSHHGESNRLPPGLKPLSLPFYSGDRTEDLMTWLSQATALFRMSGGDVSEEMKATYVGQFLTGNAAAWFMSVTQAEAPNRVTNWTQFCDQIVLEFVPFDTAQEARTKFSRLTAEGGQKGILADYTSQFRTVYNVMRHHGSSYSDADLQFYYLQGLRSDDIRSKIMMEKPLNMEDLIAKCHILDAALHKGQPDKSSRYKGDFGGNSSNQRADMDLNVVERPRPNGPKYSPEDQKEVDRRRKENLCLRCGQSGHVAGGRGAEPCQNAPTGSGIAFEKWKKAKKGPGNGQRAAHRGS